MSRAQPSLFGPGQARPLVTAQEWLWPGSELQKAKAAGSGRGFVVQYLHVFYFTFFFDVTSNAFRMINVDRCSDQRLFDSDTPCVQPDSDDIMMVPYVLWDFCFTITPSKSTLQVQCLPSQRLTTSSKLLPPSQMACPNLSHLARKRTRYGW